MLVCNSMLLDSTVHMPSFYLSLYSIHIDVQIHLHWLKKKKKEKEVSEGIEYTTTQGNLKIFIEFNAN